MAINVKDKLVTLESLGVAYSAEQDAREEADQALSTRIDNIVAPDGDPSLTEVSDARVSGSTTYNTLKARLDADKAAIGTEISQLSANLGSIIGEETEETITEITGLNFAANTTKFYSSSNYSVHYFAVTVGTVYTIVADNATNNNPNVTPIRLVFSENVPAANVAGTYIEEVTVPKYDTLTYTYVPSRDGYFCIAYYRNVYTLFSATSNSGGIDSQVRSLEYSLGDVESTLNTRMDGVEADNARALDAVSVLGEAIETPTGDVSVSLELGNITFYGTGPRYYASDKRVRTVEGTTIKLKAGGTIGLSDYTDAKFWPSWIPDGESTWVDNAGWKTANFTVPVDGEYIIIIANKTEITQESYEALGNLLVVRKGNNYHDAVVHELSVPPITHYEMAFGGYIATDGITIMSANATKKERHTDYIPVEYGKKYVVDYRVKEITTSFISYSTYDSEKAPVLARKSYDNGFALGDDGYYRITFKPTITDSVAYIRISAQTYGDGFLTICEGDSYICTTIQPVLQKFRKERDKAINAIYQPDIYRPIYSPVMYDAVCKGINHRGHSSCPENTLVAYQASKANGFYFVETDVRVTSDDEFVLLHDTSINSVARNADGTSISETVNIADITLAEALTYDFGIAKDQDFAGTKIATLAEFLAYCKRALLHPYIEVKFSDMSYIDALVDMVDSYGLRGRSTYITGNMTALKAIVTKDKMARVGYTDSNPALTIMDTLETLKTGYNEVFINVETIRDGLIDACVAHKIPLELWTYSASQDAILAKPDYVTGITHNSRHAGKLIYDSVVTE